MDTEVRLTANLASVEAEVAKRTQQGQNNGEDDEMKRRHEQARLAKVTAQRAREAAEAELERKEQAIRKAKRVEKATQQKLREMGVCVAGYRWIKQW